MRRWCVLSALVVAGCVGGRGPIPDGGVSLDLTTNLDFASTSPPSGCGQQLGDTPVTFCETFDKPAGGGQRGGDLDGNVWSVARVGMTAISGFVNAWVPTLIDECDGTMPRVSSPKDIIICNGQLREAVNDNSSGMFGDGYLTSLAMSPTQPFDFAGRTGTVSFDVSNDAGGNKAWPELWIADAPVPDPFAFQGVRQTLAPNAIGVRFNSVAGRGNQGECGNGNNLAANRFTVGSAAVVRDYVLDDTEGSGPRLLQLQVLDCVIESVGPGQMNRIEVRVSQSQIDVYATDAGVVPTKETLRHIAVITGAQIGFSRGYVSLEDIHDNGDGTDPTSPSQREHTFAWDNLAFDGPFTYRDFAFEAPDETAASGADINLGQVAAAGETCSWSIPGLPAAPSARTANVTFDLDTGNRPDPSHVTVVVNGHTHAVPWPFSDTTSSTRPFAVPVPLTDLVAGTNTVQLGADQLAAYFDVDLVLGDVQGGVAVLPGASRAYP